MTHDSTMMAGRACLCVRCEERNCGDFESDGGTRPGLPSDA